MTESTWEILGRPVVVPSLGGIGFFRGKMITLCGRFTQTSRHAHGTSTEITQTSTEIPLLKMCLSLSLFSNCNYETCLSMNK
jgi:hypothetical protein